MNTFTKETQLQPENNKAGHTQTENQPHIQPIYSAESKDTEYRQDSLGRTVDYGWMEMSEFNTTANLKLINQEEKKKPKKQIVIYFY